MTTRGEREFWCAIYRAVQALAAAIKRYKLAGDDDPGDSVATTGADVTTTYGVCTRDHCACEGVDPR